MAVKIFDHPVWAIFLTVALAGCATAPSAPAVHCPPLKPYTSLEQAVLADELVKDGPEAQSWISDYLALRKACRGQ